MAGEEIKKKLTFKVPKTQTSSAILGLHLGPPVDIDSVSHSVTKVFE